MGSKPAIALGEGGQTTDTMGSVALLKDFQGILLVMMIP